MIGMKDKIPLSIELGTLATLISGLYCTYSAVDPMAIPTSVYIELAEKLVPYLEKWDYEKLSFEDWIKYNLLIIPKVMVEDSIDEFKENDLYFERENGRVILVVTAEMI